MAMAGEMAGAMGETICGRDSVAHSGSLAGEFARCCLGRRESSKWGHQRFTQGPGIPLPACSDLCILFNLNCIRRSFWSHDAYSNAPTPWHPINHGPGEPRRLVFLFLYFFLTLAVVRSGHTMFGCRLFFVFIYISCA
jgi:hypothetical protein